MKKAFTMIELLVVIGIIALLVAILVPALSGSTESAKAAKCLSNMHQLASGIQSHAMSSGNYPLAGSVEKYIAMSAKHGTRALHGWIGWSSDSPSGSYISPYSTDANERMFSLTNGSVWTAVSRMRDIYVCPTHRDVTRRKLGAADKYGPCWSYVMNARFGWQYQDKPLNYKYYGEAYGSCRSPAKTLLLAELPFLELPKPYDTIQTPEFNKESNKNNDPVLQFNECAGGGDEIIGFNHSSGKRNYFGHVCFADGHTEKFRLTPGTDKGNLKDLTKWLCKPECLDTGTGWNRKRRDFDVVLRTTGKYDVDSKSK